MNLALFALALLLSAAPAIAAECPRLLDHRYKTLQGGEVNLCDYADRAILVVNTASKCGYTPQFEKLEGLYKKYKDKGLMVVGFPSNDFNQELATNKEIGDFCRLTYSVQFPMIEKTSVKGPTANPLFKQLAAATGHEPGWNFHKVLSGRDGALIAWFPTQTPPLDAKITGAARQSDAFFRVLARVRGTAAQRMDDRPAP